MGEDSIVIDRIDTHLKLRGKEVGKEFMRLAYDRGIQEGKTLTLEALNRAGEIHPATYYRKLGFSTGNDGFDKELDKLNTKGERLITEEAQKIPMYLEDNSKFEQMDQILP